MKKLKVLLIDDSEDILDLLKINLSSLEIEVVAVSSIDSARKVLSSSSKFDIVISDLELGTPETGVDLLRETKKAHPDILLWLMSGNPDKVPKYNVVWSHFFLKPSNICKDIKKMISSVAISKIMFPQ